MMDGCEDFGMMCGDVWMERLRLPTLPYVRYVSLSVTCALCLCFEF
jgi:hypothetical protein